MKVLVLGGGVIGVTTAYHLARDGHEVLLIERREGVALETSFANGGQVSASHAEPWANPAALVRALRWFGRKDAPLRLGLRLDPALWRWLLLFLGNCTEARARLNTERTLRIALYSRDCFGRVRTNEGSRLGYDLKTRGILHFYRDPREFERAIKAANLMRDFGLSRQYLDPKECVAVEPALAHARDRLAGGLYSPDDESGDAHLFTTALAARAAELGVGFRHDAAVSAIEAEGGRFCAVRLADGERITADAAVVALGSYSPLLLRPLGIRLPVYPAKGYSVTLPVENPAAAPEVSLTDDELKLVYSRLGDRLRVAGTAEFVGFDTTLDEDRARGVLRAALALLPGVGDPEKAVPWTGLRPKTPDSVPIIGATPVSGLYVNTGHGTLGWTMSCGSGRIVADLISGRKPEIDLTGLGPERFS